MTILGLHHITLVCSDAQRTVDFYTGILGQRLVKKTVNFDDPGAYHLYFGDEVGRPGSAITFFEWPHAQRGQPGTLITYFERDPARTRRVQMGAGQTHHFALAVPDEETQLEWRDKILKAGFRVSPVMDRIYFKSIYTNDPDGHIVELATAGPGFTVDEDVAELGQQLKLPPWLESSRNRIEQALQPVIIPAWHTPEVV